jgi:5-oxopent-3-ene-1,2,5-tricarboxylate decarboxylase/2-hydroxyhepta-2,4-diene-1,7-dioate isomerase
MPGGAGGIEIGASLGIVIGRVAYRVPMAESADVVADCVIAGDLGRPPSNHYRRSVRLKARDGCPVLGPWFVDTAEVPDPHTLDLRTLVNGRVARQGNTADFSLVDAAAAASRKTVP